MYTLTRKIAVVSLTAVLSVLAYGCGGGSSDGQTSTTPIITDVSTASVTDGVEITPGTYTIQPGETMEAGGAAFSCPAEGSPCVVTVADGTVTSAGGMATAMNSAAERREA